MSDNKNRSGRNGIFSVLGCLGAIFSCCALMASLVMSILGFVGARAATGISQHPAWVKPIMHFATPILVLSLILVVIGIWRATKLTRTVVSVGIVLMLLNMFIKPREFPILV